MISLNRALKPRHFLFAGILAVTIPMLLGYVIFRTAPSACYDSPCALPLLLVTASPVAAPVLAILFALNRRAGKPIPDGWLPMALISGVVGQIAVSLFGVALASPNIRRIFFWDVLFVPQGLVVGLAVGLVFWLGLYAFGKPPAQA